MDTIDTIQENNCTMAFIKHDCRTESNFFSSDFLEIVLDQLLITMKVKLQIRCGTSATNHITFDFSLSIYIIHTTYITLLLSIFVLLL